MSEGKEIQQQPQAFSVNLPEPVPFLIAAPTEEELAKLFDGPIPAPGDRVEMICYGAVGNARFFKWRVVR